jgi:predicted Kef-type K+ transport protein
MTHEIDIILTLTGGLTAALILGFFAQWLRLSPIATSPCANSGLTRSHIPG